MEAFAIIEDARSVDNQKAESSVLAVLLQGSKHLIIKPADFIEVIRSHYRVEIADKQSRFSVFFENFAQVVYSSRKAADDGISGIFVTIIFMTVNNFVFGDPPAAELRMIGQRIKITVKIVLQIFNDIGQGVVA